MEVLTALIFSVVLDGLWDAKDYEPPVPEYGTSKDWHLAELECTETGFAYPGVFASEFESAIEIANRDLCIEQKITQTVIERKEVQTEVSEINEKIQQLIEQRKDILNNG